jgi:tetratricopeptide (TPR) repeat protein
MANSSIGKYNVQDILTRAYNAQHTGDYDVARRFYVRCIEIEPNNQGIQLSYGEFLAEIGSVDEAKQIFKKICNDSTQDVNASAIFSLAQLQSGKEASNTFEQGILALQAQLKSSNNNNNNNNESITKQIASAYCRIIEIYMTDLCFEQNAEQICVEAATKAVEYGGNDNAEALYCYANVSLSQCKNDIAKDYIIKAADALQIAADKDQEEVNDFEISYDLQLNIAKVLIEVNEPSKASDILERLLLINDTDIELLFVAGICYNTLQEFNISKQYLMKSKEIIDQLKNSGEDYGDMDLERYLQQINNMLNTVNASLQQQTNNGQ